MFKRGTTQVLSKVEKKIQIEVLSTSVREIKPNTDTMEIA
jgi:hypothetical protein